MARFRTVLVALIPAALLGWAAIHLASRGHPVALPLDDAYIYLQYARTAAGGCPGSYTHDGPVSSGFTSPLWFAIHAGRAGFMTAIGMGTRALPLSALLTDALAAALGFWLLLRLARVHGVRGPVQGLPIVLSLLVPFWLFGAMNGMETGLYGASLAAAAWALAGGSTGWLLLPALVRPEGAAIALLVLGARRFARGRRPAGSAAGETPWSRRGLVLGGAVLAAAALTLLLPRLLTGAPSAGWTGKALWTEPKPDVREFYLPRLPTFAARTLWFGMSGGRGQPPLKVLDDVLRPEARVAWVWALFLTGGAILALARRRGRGPLALWIPATLLALVPVAWDAHFYRYLVPAIPLLFLAATAGWFAGDAPGPARFRRGIGGALFVTLALGTIFPSPGYATRFRRLYRGECEKIEANQLRTGAWIAEHLPPGARVATHDVGAIAYAGERPVVDLVGLTTPALAGAYRHGEGALWEALASLPPEQRPTHVAVIPAWIPYLSRTLWFRERLWSVGAETPAGTSPPGRDFEVWSLSWPGAEPATWPEGDLGDVPRDYGPRAGDSEWEIVDGVDVADLRSEEAHGYRQEPPSRGTEVRNLGFGAATSGGASASAIEGGRDATGVARFTLHARPDASARLVLRGTATRSMPLEVRIGSWSGILFIPRSETRFSESSVLIPSTGIAPGKDGGVEVEVEVEVRGEGYRAFHWWLLQSLPEETEGTTEGPP